MNSPQHSPRTSLVVVPTYDEAESIGAVLDAVLRAAPGVDVLVVDDASPDGTARRVRRHPSYGGRLMLLERSGKGGLGSAYRAGFGWALERGYDAVVEMDADLSHPPAVVPALLAALATADLAIGSRYVPGGATVGWPRHRALISRAGNAYVRLVLGLPVHDATAGFRAFRTSALQTIDVLHCESDGYAFQVETTWRSARSGLTVVEVPITFTERALGASKMTTTIVAEALLRVLGWRLRELTGRARRWHPTTPPSPGLEHHRAA